MDSLAIVNKFFPSVKSVKDAVKPVQIEVTASDIRSSQSKNHKACAMAVACKRMMHLDGVIISRSVAYLIKDNVATRYLVPNAAAREVIAFDRGGTFEAGEYSLIKPHDAIAINGNRRAATTRRRKDERKKRTAPRHFTTNIRAALGITNVTNGRRRRY